MSGSLVLVKVAILTLAILAGCALNLTPGSSEMRALATAELDRITVGSAGASIELAASALPPAAQTTASTHTLAIAGSGSLAGPPFLGNLSENFSTSQGAASATSGQLAQTSGSSNTSVSGVNGGAAIEATATSLAAGGEMGRTQVNFQFQGFSTARADLVYGTASATACCAPALSAGVTADAQAGGRYSAKLQANYNSGGSDQVQSRVDLAVASSALPIVDPGQIMSLQTPRGSPIY
jgi:hypothetical protein